MGKDMKRSPGQPAPWIDDPDPPADSLITPEASKKAAVGVAKLMTERREQPGQDFLHRAAQQPEPHARRSAGNSGAVLVTARGETMDAVEAGWDVGSRLAEAGRLVDANADLGPDDDGATAAAAG